MPYYQQDGRHLQILISEYSMKSILKTIVDSNVIKYNKTLSMDEISSLIEDFDKTFGNENNVMVKFESAPSSEYEP